MRRLTRLTNSQSPGGYFSALQFHANSPVAKGNPCDAGQDHKSGLGMGRFVWDAKKTGGLKRQTAKAFTFGRLTIVKKTFRENQFPRVVDSSNDVSVTKPEEWR